MAPCLCQNVFHCVCVLSMPEVLISCQCELDSQRAFLSLSSAPFGKVTQDCLFGLVLQIIK